MKPQTLILRTAGTNCDEELAHAFELAGAATTRVHLNQLLAEPAMLEGFDILGLPGGFSYGDDIAAGRIFANIIRHRLMDDIRRFVAAGKPVIGICNGFQLLVKAGLLPGFDPADPQQSATLADNADHRFTDRWVATRCPAESVCIWTRGLDTLDLPIANGEGRFVASEETLNRLESQNQIALRYTENPNGSMRDIAGICDPTGLVFGLMPHPERFIHATQHPQWTRLHRDPAGLKMFTNAVEHAMHATTAVQNIG